MIRWPRWTHSISPRRIQTKTQSATSTGIRMGQITKGASRGSESSRGQQGKGESPHSGIKRKPDETESAVASSGPDRTPSPSESHPPGSDPSPRRSQAGEQRHQENRDHATPNTIAPEKVRARNDSRYPGRQKSSGLARMALCRRRIARAGPMSRRNPSPSYNSPCGRGTPHPRGESNDSHKHGINGEERVCPIPVRKPLSSLSAPCA